MRGIPGLEGALNNLIRGTMLNYIQCVNVDYQSSRQEKIIFLQLQVKGQKDIYASLDTYVTPEDLTGDNQYNAGSQYGGKQDAKKGCVFTKLPPVLFIQLCRFTFDYATLQNVKVSTFPYP